MIKKSKFKGSLLYIMIISVVLLLAALSISLITSFMLGGAKKSVLKNQARFTAKSVAAQTLFRMDLVNSIMVQNVWDPFDATNPFRIQDINWGEVLSQSSDRKMIFPKSPAEKGDIPPNSFGGFTVDVNFNGGRYSSIDNLYGMESALFPYTGKKEINPYSLSLLINLESKDRTSRRYYIDIGKQWDYAVSTFDAPLTLDGYSKVTGDIASFYNPYADKANNKTKPTNHKPSRPSDLYNPFCIIFKESTEPFNVSSLLRGNICTSNSPPSSDNNDPAPEYAASQSRFNTSFSDTIFIDGKVLDRWMFGDKVYGIPQIKAQNLGLLISLSVATQNETAFDLIPEMDKNGFAKTYVRTPGMKITNPDLWGNPKLADFFDRLGSPEQLKNDSNKGDKPKPHKRINFVELHKPLKLCGDVKNDPDVISGHSSYVIDGCVVAQGAAEAGEITQDAGPIPGIELENCRLTINGDLYLSGVKMFLSNVPEEGSPVDSEDAVFTQPNGSPGTLATPAFSLGSGDSSVISNQKNTSSPLRVIKALTPQQVKNAPGIRGKNSALIVKGNIFLMNAKMENSGLNFVIYSTRNILLRPVERPGNIIFCGAVVAQGNIYIVPMKYTDLTPKSLSKDIVTIKGCVACSGSPVRGSSYDASPLNVPSGGNNYDEDYRKGLTGLNLNTINVQYDASATGILNSIAGWPRIKNWRELY